MAGKTREVAEQLATLCRENRTDEGLNTLYHADCVSVEAGPAPGADSAETHGLDGIRGKHEWWENAMEVHSATVEGPFMHGEDRFGLIFEMDTTERESGQRMAMKELGVYTVNADGKIVREEFFYTM